MASSISDSPTYSFVIPVYNEEETLPELQKRLADLLLLLDGPAEILLVDDGSRDRSYGIMTEIAARDSRFKIISLSRNFGHQIAITAGIDFARGQAVVIMDADLQDPPEVVLEMAARWRQGAHIVYGVRETRTEDTWFKRTTAGLFYRLLRRLTEVDIPAEAGDFRLVDRRAIDAFKSLREQSRFVRGMFSWIGFRQEAVYYKRAARFAGSTKYPFRKMLRLAFDAVISFSNVPLRLTLNVGFYISALSFAMGLIWIGLKLFGVNTVPGWASIAVAITFLGGVQLLMTGIIGEYLGRIYEEVRRRPLYFVQEAWGFDASPYLSASAVAQNGNGNGFHSAARSALDEKPGIGREILRPENEEVL